MLGEYRTLESLLSQQKDALAKGDFATLRSLHKTIGDHAEKVAANDDFSGLSVELRSELENLIRRIDERIQENQATWQKLIDQAQNDTTQLRAQRRYFSAFHNPPPGGTRYSRTG